MPDFDELADELYAVLPAEFITARDDAVAQVKAADKGLARKVGALGKPTLAAWTVNTLVRHAGDQVQELVSLGELLREAQDGLDPESMRALGKQRQQVVRALAREAGKLARRAGHPVSDAVTTQVEETLKAAVADPAAAEQVLAGRLTGALSYNGLGTPEPAPAPPPRPARKPGTAGAAGKPATDDEPPPAPLDLDAARSAKAERAARRDAEERLRTARGELRAARAALDEATGEAEQATTVARDAQHAAAQARTARAEADARVAELADALEKARERAAAAAEDAGTAAEDADRTEADRSAAEQELQRATEERDRAQEKVDELS